MDDHLAQFFRPLAVAPITPSGATLGDAKLNFRLATHMGVFLFPSSLCSLFIDDRCIHCRLSLTCKDWVIPAAKFVKSVDVSRCNKLDDLLQYRPFLDKIAEHGDPEELIDSSFLDASWITHCLTKLTTIQRIATFKFKHSSISNVAFFTNLRYLNLKYEYTECHTTFCSS
jgi:hypothetical protein